MTPPATYDLTELKTRLDIVEVARLCGLDPKKSGSAWVARCPAHPDSPEGRPNLALHATKGAKCFRCGWQADVIGLAVKAKGGNFSEVVTWLASLAGLAPAGEGSRGRRSGSGLGYNGKGQGRDMYPKGAPLPAAGDRPPAVRIIGDLPPDPGLVLRPEPAATQDARPWAGFDTFDDLEAATGRAYVALVETTRRLGLDVDDPSTATDAQVAPLLAEYRRLDTAWAAALDLAPLAGDNSSTLRVRVFDAFLAFTVPAGEVPRAAAWLRDKKGLTDQTQAAAGLRWLTDWQAADKGLKAAFDGDKAGREAAQKVAALFVSEGLTAPKIVKLPDGQDVTDYFTHQRSKTRV